MQTIQLNNKYKYINVVKTIKKFSNEQEIIIFKHFL